MMMFFMLYWLNGGEWDQSHKGHKYISKSIRKHLRRALREQRHGRIKHVLDEFKVLDRLTHHARAPVYPCPTRKDEKCPGADEFANFLQQGFGILNVSPWLN